MGIIEAITGIGDLGLGVFQAWQNDQIAKKNFALQEQNLEWMKGVQAKQWQREDSSSQRKMEDLKKAGLNPMLAYDMQASSSAPIKTEAPRMENPRTGETLQIAIANALALMKGAADISKTNAETNRIQRLTDLEVQSFGYDVQKKKAESSFYDLIATREWEKIDQEVANLMTRNKIYAVERELKEKILLYEVDQARIDWYIKKLEERYANQTYDKRQLDIEAAKLAIKEKEYNLKWYENAHQPTNAGLGGVAGNILRGTGTMADILGDIYDSMKRSGGK